MIGKTLSHYRILAKLGKGGMGEVYLAEDTTLKREVALKVLPPDLAESPERLERFQREAESLASLNHPNIVTIHSIEEDGGRRFLTMERVRGETLGEVISKGGLPLDRVFEIAIPLADALAVAHEHGVVHRDLKPGNVMITPEGRVKVLDFGLAKLVEDEAGFDRTQLATEPLTQEGMAMGTMPYMSPEQVQGKAVDHRSDIFSLGIVLYEMCTGRRPFQGDTSADLISSILRDSPDSVSEIRTEMPRHFGRIIRHCLEKDPQRRYQSALDVRNEIEGLCKEVESGEILVSGVTGAVPVVEATMPKWLPLAGLVGLLVVGGAVAWWIGGRSGSSTDVTSSAGEQAERQMVVVLPFENLGSPDDEYFAAGMTEEITSRLAAVSGMGVISRNSAVRYAGTDKSIRQIGEELGVQYVLAGTVRWAKSAERSRVRITPQLIRVADDTQSWTATYDRVIDDIFEVQSDIAGQVIGALGVTLLDTEQQSVAARPTENLEAYQAYLRGLDQTGHLAYSEEHRMLEIEMFERAVELDPEFAVAWSALSMAHSGLINLGMDKSPERLALAKAAVDRAIELDPDLPEAHLAMAYYHYWGLRDYEPALEALAIVEKSLPNHPDVLIANFAIRRRQGRLDEALEYLDRAFELSPRDAELPREIAAIHLMNRDPDRAFEALDRSIALAPDQQAAYAFEMMAYFTLGDLEGARRAFERMPRTAGAYFSMTEALLETMSRNWEAVLTLFDSAPTDVLEMPGQWMTVDHLKAEVYRSLGQAEQSSQSYESALGKTLEQLVATPDDARVRSSLGLIYAGLGRAEDAVREGKRALEMYPPEKDALHGPRQVENLAQIYLEIGDFDRAAEQLDRALTILNWLTAAQVDIEPKWDAGRDHPAIQAVLDKHR